MKQLIIFILFLYPVLSFGSNADSTGKRVITYTGDTLLMSKEISRTVRVGDTIRRFTTKKPKPAFLNGEKILHWSDAFEEQDNSDSAFYAIYTSTMVRHNKNMEKELVHVFMNNYKTVYRLIDSCLDEFDSYLENHVVSVRIDNVVVDADGQVVYFENGGIKGRAAENVRHLEAMKGDYTIPAPLRTLIDGRMDVMLKSLKLEPLIYKGKASPSCYATLSPSVSRGAKEYDDTLMD